MSNGKTTSTPPKLDAVTAWLACVVRIAKAPAFVGHGVDVLVDVALTSGGGRRSRTDANRVKVWPEPFERLLCNLPRRCFPPLDALDAPEFSLVKMKHALQQHLVERRFVLQNTRLDKAAIVKLVDRIRDEHHAARGRPRRGTIIELDIDARAPSPQSLARAAYDVLKSRSEELQVGPIDTDAVLLLGALRAALVTRMSLCGFCFRWALPGNRYCFEHTLSGPNQLASERQRRYASGAGIARRFKATPAACALAPSLGKGQTSTSLARALLGSVAPKEDVQLLRVSRALAKSPNLLAAVGADLAHIKPPFLQAELRLRLDPLEWRLGGWLAKIRAAEVWYELLPGVRGRGRAAEERIQEAVRLARRGLSKSEVARRLELSPSAITRWLQRHPDDPEVAKLADLFRRSDQSRAE